jgi:hypothetical protein
MLELGGEETARNEKVRNTNVRRRELPLLRLGLRDEGK